MPSRRVRWLLALALVVSIVCVYAPIGAHDWVRYDDEDYLLDNPHVARGLEWAEIQWVWTHAYAGNYHPLTWMAHMLDVELFGLAPGPHHWVNVGLHALNGVLVLVLLVELLGNPWAAGLGAAGFALHPLRVESVAWASERKDVLCASYFLAAVWLYLRYARRPSLGRYLLVGLAFALALLAKPMAVTLPGVLLLLDVWPLGRVLFWKPRAQPPIPPSLAPTHPGGAPAQEPRVRFRYGPFLEKVPLFALAALAGLATLWAQGSAGSTSSVSALGLDVRIVNALASLTTYLSQNLVPRGLSVFYPHAAILSAEPLRELALPALIGAALLAAGLVLAWRSRQRAPAVAVGLALFGVTLLPVIGLVQVGTQAHADRYTYLPSVGLALALAGGALALGAGRALAGLGLVAALLLGGLARHQLGFWKDTRTLFEHALALDERNYLAHTKLGEVALAEGDVSRARAACQRALAIHPRFAHALGKLALCALASGELDQARARLRQALALEPEDQELVLNLGVVELERGELDAAREHFEACFARDPADPDVLFNLGVLAQRAGRLDEAERYFDSVLTLDPQHADACSNLGQIRLARGQNDAAVEAFRHVLALEPKDPLAHYNLGVALQKQSDLPGARQSFQRALELEPEFELARAALQTLGVEHR